MSPRTRPRPAMAAALVVLALAVAGCGADQGDASGDGSPGASSAGTTSPTVAVPAPELADQPYTTSPTDTQVLDLWVPPQADGPSPVVVFVHGGGWVEGDKSQVRSKLAHLLDRGFAVASIDYRLSTDALFPAAVEDAKAAVRWLRANAEANGLDPDAIAVWGESAGGNLAALVGVTGDQPSPFDDPELGNPGTSSAVQAVVDWFGPVDLLQLQRQEADDTPCTDPYDHDAGDSYESRWLGISLQYAETATLADPITWIPTAGVLPPFSIAHGDADCVVDVGQSRLLATALEQAGQQPQVLTLEGGSHMDARFDLELLDPTIDWLQQALGR